MNASRNQHVVDLRCDTLTEPTSEMRKAMFEAVVGDDDYEEDPTVKNLEQQAAQLLEKEAALFVSSGTMANLIAIMIHCNRRGAEAICGDLSHVYLREHKGITQIAGVFLNSIKTKENGTFCLKELLQKITSTSEIKNKSTLVLVENTHNMCGGKVVSLNWLQELSQICKSHKIMLHMDGARLFNAVTYLNVPASRIVRDVDSVFFCLNKGLACPVGSILLGTREFIKEARHLRKILGGGMTQIGILAAAGHVALEQIVPLLKHDHIRTKRIAEAIHQLNSPNFTVHIDAVQTNIFLLHIQNEKVTSKNLSERLNEVTEDEIRDRIIDEHGRGIVVKTISRYAKFLRIILYLGIDDLHVDLAIKKIVYVLREFDRKFSEK